MKLDNIDKMICILILLTLFSGMIGLLVINKSIHIDYALVGMVGFISIPILFFIIQRQSNKQALHSFSSVEGNEK